MAALLRVKLLCGAWFHAPLALLHASLALRLAGGAVEPAWRTAGALGNAMAMGLFVAVVIASAIAWRLKYAARGTHRFDPGQQQRRWADHGARQRAEAP